MRKLVLVALATLLLAACSSIDCPLNNLVYTKYKLAGSMTTLHDTLTISTTMATGDDSVLINKDVNVDSFNLPMSYQHQQDVFYTELKNVEGEVTLDTITVSKTDQPHFEAVDCAPSFFHVITGVSYTMHAIDSIVINNINVNYETNSPHFLIYFKGTAH